MRALRAIEIARDATPGFVGMLIYDCDDHRVFAATVINL